MFTFQAQNVHAFTSNDRGDSSDDYMSLTVDEAMRTTPPNMFISFPSAKDPRWGERMERREKATCIVIALCNTDWFEEFKGTGLHERGER